jgi:hypothetical protein
MLEMAATGWISASPMFFKECCERAGRHVAQLAHYKALVTIFPFENWKFLEA